MDLDSKVESAPEPSFVPAEPFSSESSTPTRTKSKPKDKDTGTNLSTNANPTTKRRVVSTACIACRRRKSKCDGAQPSCAACSSVYMTECEYAPHTDHRRKGVYKKDTDNVKTKNTTLQVLIHAILNLEEDDAFDLVREIRTCDNLEDLAQNVENREKGVGIDSHDSSIYGSSSVQMPQFEAELSGKMGDLLIDGSVKFIGGTSNLIWLNDSSIPSATSPSAVMKGVVRPREEAILSWTTITRDKDLILHFVNMYFCWHYAYFTTLSKELFYRDFLTGVSSEYCSHLLVNVMLALGCHFSLKPAARADPDDSSTTGDHYFDEAKRLLQEDEEFASPKLCTVQALALMSVREAGCGRESKGWLYSGMSFRMASDLGLDVDSEPINNSTNLSDEDIDARRITFWGCFFFDKCWSNYLGRQPQLQPANINVKKPDVFPSEESELWSPYTDSGIIHAHTQPARTRAVALQIFKLGEISSDLLSAFYQPQNLEKPPSKQAELKKLSDIHTRLESWKRELPSELDPKDGQLPQILLMHMFYQLLYIHLYRPFLRYNKSTSPLPAHVSPRKFCTQAAGTISKLFRLYKRTHGLRQICNIAVYIAHSACTIHLLNLPDRNARRDIIHGVKQLEDIGECWICARRTLSILGLCAEKWQIELPEEVQACLIRSRQRWSLMSPPSPSMLPEATVTSFQQPKAHPSIDGMAQSLKQQQQQQQQLQQKVQVQEVRRQQLEHSQQTINDTRLSISPRGPPGYLNPTASLPAPKFEVSAPRQIPFQSQGLNDTPRGNNRLKSFAQLTKVQQDAWNAHQARMANMNNSIAKTVSSDSANNNAAVLFGGVDSLIEESQDWWMNDQAQLATGFENWNSPSTTEWPAAGMGYENSTMTPSVTSTPQYYDNDILHNGYNGLSSLNNASGSNIFAHSQHQRLQRQSLPHPPGGARQPLPPNSIGRNDQGMAAVGGLNPTTAHKRPNSFDDDDDMYY